jgi:2-keto-4-pentenoate hydratase/2-oxohepta-3-ene-1,7-dioic acid hydratase in catechol pathway
MRPFEMSCSVAYERARTFASRVAGFVTKWPSLILVVSRAATARVGIDSCQRTCESYVHAYSKPWRSASWISSSQRLYGGSGRTVTPKLIDMQVSLLRHDLKVKIICVGRNYAEHAAELGDEPPTAPLLFGKFDNALVGPGEPIVLPPEATHVDAEAELAVEIGRGGHRIPEADALDHVRGYRAANDVSARNIQYSESQWARAKGFDTFCPLGDQLAPVSELGDGAGLRVVQRLNGEVLQDGNTSDLIFPVPFLVAYISNTFTLEPGDLILTGTPPGVGWARDPKVTLQDGDVVEVEVEGIGVLRNQVTAE